MAVYCSQCGTKNSDDAGSCVSCNATIARVMPNSGTDSGTDGGGGFAKNISATNVLIAGVCLIYLINPTAGFIELIPDNIPIIGNLDEAAAMIGLLMSMSAMGLIPARWITLFEQFTGRRVL